MNLKSKYLFKKLCKWVKNIYNVAFMVLEIRSERQFFVILGHFPPFDSHNDSENQNFEKMKKMSGNIILLHVCTINENYMIYGS